jgi:tRNA-dihydrouridine synthase 1
MRPALRVLHRLTTTVDLFARDAVPRATAHTARPTANHTHGVLRNLHRAMTAQAQATTSPTHGASVGNAAACDPPACGTDTTGTEPIAESNPVASTSGGMGLPTPPSPATATNKLTAWDFWRSMGSPKFHVAPMVDQSELAFRELCRRYGATCAYTPMIHARLFVESPKYREEIFTTHITDRPLLVQFCANDPDMLLEAAKLVAPHCDGVDINFGCPQRIAKKGNYGAYLMDQWDVVHDLIYKLHKELPVPVTAKIRVYDDLETSIKYAKMVEAAGAQLVAVHGRTRTQKRASDVRANWAFIAEIKKQLKIPVLANGDIRSLREARLCLEQTGCDGVLSADPLLEHPSLFSDPPFAVQNDLQNPLPIQGDKNVLLLLEYLEITKKYKTPLRMVKGHAHKMVGAWLAEFTDLREFLNGHGGPPKTTEVLIAWTNELLGRVRLVQRTEGRSHPIPKKSPRQAAREEAEEAKTAAIAEQQREDDAFAGTSSSSFLSRPTPHATKWGPNFHTRPPSAC